MLIIFILPTVGLVQQLPSHCDEVAFSQIFLCRACLENAPQQP